MSIARIAAGPGVSWHTVNDAVLATGHQLLIADPTRYDGVQVLGVDEHAWRHTRRGGTFVTAIKQVLKTWLEAQTPAFRDGIEIVAMDGLTGSVSTTATRASRTPSGYPAAGGTATIFWPTSMPSADHPGGHQSSTARRIRRDGENS